MRRPFQHIEEEFHILVTWMVEEGKNIGIRNESSIFARALKFFIRFECGGRIPLLCPVQGLTLDVLLARANQVLFAMEELIRVGKIYFPTLDTTNDKLSTSEELLIHVLSMMIL